MEDDKKDNTTQSDITCGVQNFNLFYTLENREKKNYDFRF